MSPQRKELILDEISSLLDVQMLPDTTSQMNIIFESHDSVDWQTNQKTREHTGRKFMLFGIIPKELQEDYDFLVKKIQKYSNH